MVAWYQVTRDLYFECRFYGNFTLDLVARCAFGTMLESHSDQSNEFVSYGTKAFGEGISFASVIFCGFQDIIIIIVNFI